MKATPRPWVESAYTGKRIVTTKPGEQIRFKGELQWVIGVSVYRASPLVPWQRPLNTGVAEQPWGSLDMVLVDPFDNRLIFKNASGPVLRGSSSYSQ